MKIEINKPLSPEVQHLIRRNTTVSEIKEVAKMYGISEAVFQHLFYDKKGRYKVSNENLKPLHFLIEHTADRLYIEHFELKQLKNTMHETIQPHP